MKRPVALTLPLVLAGTITTAVGAAVDPAPELSLCPGKPLVMAALSRPTTQARAAPERQRLTIQLSPEKTVALPAISRDLEKERAKVKGPTYGGIVRLNVARAGVYRIGTGRDVWLDVVSPSGKLLDPAREEGVFACDGANKILLYTFEAAGSYWLQVALSPKPDILLVVIRAD